MSLRLVGLLCVLSAVLSVALTRHFWPSIQTVQTTKEVVRTDVQTVTHTVTLKDGSVDTTTTTTDHSVRTDVAKIVVNAKPILNVSALVANDFSKSQIQPIYGVSVSKEVLSNITIGVFGLTSGTLGLSVGINF